MWTSRVLAVTACLLVVLVASASRSEQQPQAPVDRWEYGELKHDARAFGTKGGAPARKKMTVWWFSAEGVVEGADLEELAANLKAPAAKQESSGLLHRIRVLNHLGSQGWELISYQVAPDSPGIHHWILKRKVTK